MAQSTSSHPTSINAPWMESYRGEAYHPHRSSVSSLSPLLGAANDWELEGADCDADADANVVMGSEGPEQLAVLKHVQGSSEWDDHIDRQLNLAEDRRLGITCFATLGGFLFGYDQGVVSNVLAMESFGAAFPDVYMDANLKGWFVSTLLLAAWVGSLVNGPVCDKIGRKRSIMCNVVLFLVGTGLANGGLPLKVTFVDHYLFGGRVVAGLAVGALTHVVPMYLAEISIANIRGSLVALQQLSITAGIFVSYWLAYGTSHIGGTRCAPGVPYTGPLLNGSPTFDPYTDVPAGGCTGQTQASWRIPIGFQMLPAICLGIGMAFMPYSPRWLMEQGREAEALATLSMLRQKPLDHVAVRYELLEIKAEVLYCSGGERSERIRMQFKRLAMGCLTMFYQQFIIYKAIIYYAPTIRPGPEYDLFVGYWRVWDSEHALYSSGRGLLDSVGRRPLLMCGAAGCCISLVVVGTLVAAFGHDWPGHATAGHVAIAFIFLYDVNFSYSWAPIGWVIPSEIFPLHLRSTGISITTSATWMSNFVIGLVSPKMLTEIPYGGTYFFFAGFAVLAFLTTCTFEAHPVYSNGSRTLEEMDVAFGDYGSEKEREHMERICRQLGLPAKALLSA
ncbi:putative sugar transporter [Chiua virens]|nr:putative sugar transporter [Chiua virens]